MTAFDQSAFLQALGWAVLNSLWQMAFLWILFSLIQTLSTSLSTAQKSKIAASLLLTGFGWFLFTFFSLVINKENNSALISFHAVPAEINQTLNRWLDATLPFASIVYITMLIIPALHFIRNYRYVQLLRHRNLTKIHVDWRIFVRNIAAQIGIKKPVNIWVSDLISSPVTIGYLKPIILVPLAAINHLTPLQMEAVLLHELAHIRRYDYLVNLLINFVQTILYFNPFVKAFVKTVERERERSCDEMVMQFQYNPHHYASALLMLEKNSILAQHMAMAASGKSDLLSRIERILNIEKRPVFSFNKLAGFFAALLCIIVLNAVLIVGKPVSPVSDSAFDQPGAPSSFFTQDDQSFEGLKSTPIQKETNSAQVINHPVAARTLPTRTGTKPASPLPYISVTEEETNENPLFTRVAMKTELVPELSQSELKQVKVAIASTKKVVADVQWKEVVNSIADVLTTTEKKEVKQKYLKELSRVNWGKLETRLKESYDQLNWNKINAQLNSALTTIKLDSLETVYTIVSNELGKAVKEANIPGTVNIEVPMPDVSVDQLKLSRQQAQKNLLKIKAIRSRKVIHL